MHHAQTQLHVNSVNNVLIISDLKAPRDFNYTYKSFFFLLVEIVVVVLLRLKQFPI